MEAERFVYYLLLTLAGWTVAMALKALGKYYPPFGSGLGRALWKVPMAAATIFGLISWVTVVEFLHAREPFFTGIPAAMMYVGWMAYLTIHLYKLGNSGNGRPPQGAA